MGKISHSIIFKRNKKFYQKKSVQKNNRSFSHTAPQLRSPNTMIFNQCFVHTLLKTIYVFVSTEIYTNAVEMYNRKVSVAVQCNVLLLRTTKTTQAYTHMS